jgi:putative ABC transport system permease protein
VSPVPTGVALLVLAAVTFGAVSALRLEKPWLQPWALARATVQLAALTLVLSGVIADVRWAAAFLGVMIAAATWIVVRRAGIPIRRSPVAAGILAVSAALPLAVLFLTGAVDFNARYLLAVGGIVIGGCMTVSTLMGRATAAAYVSDRDEIEGWLALGATPRRAAERSIRVAASTALIPSTDQTRATGIVTLPGAFVGAVFGGADILEAAQFQLLVLAALLAAGALTVTCWTLYLGAPRTLPVRL